MDFLPPEEHQLALDSTASILGGHPFAGERTVVRKDGTRILCDVFADPITEDGEVIGARGIIFDKTEQKRLELERANLNKVETIGMLAASVVHDINNIMSAVAGNVELLSMTNPGNAQIWEFCRQLESAVNSAKSLTRQLLSFSDVEKTEPRLVVLSDVLSRSAKLVFWGTGVAVEFQGVDDSFRVLGDESRLMQVFNNIMFNACQAMNGTGRFVVRAEEVQLGGGSSPNLLPGSYFRIQLIDNGPGIPSEKLTRIFEPFFSTKEGSRGMGLAVCDSIVRKHRGLLQVESRPGEGTIFTIHLPAVPMPSGQEPAPGKLC